MTVDFGIRLPRFSPDRSEHALVYYARTLNSLSEHITTRWLDEHFQKGASPNLESWVLMAYLYWRNNHPAWQTMVFTTLTLSQLALALAVRSECDSLFHIGLRSNRTMLIAVGATLLLQLAVIYVPFLQTLFETKALSAQELAVSLVLSTLIFWGVELQKWLMRSQR